MADDHKDKQQQASDRAKWIREEIASLGYVQPESPFAKAEYMLDSETGARFEHRWRLGMLRGVLLIAGELAEINSRDTAAEIRARVAEDFVRGIQAEIAAQTGMTVSPGGIAMPAGPKKR
jgi:hypothetical protein